MAATLSGLEAHLLGEEVLAAEAHGGGGSQQQDTWPGLRLKCSDPQNG